MRSMVEGQLCLLEGALHRTLRRPPPLHLQGRNGPSTALRAVRLPIAFDDRED